MLQDVRLGARRSAQAHHQPHAAHVVGDDAVNFVRAARPLARAHDQIGHVASGAVNEDTLQRDIGIVRDYA